MQTTILLKKLVAKYIFSAMVAWVPLGSHYERDALGHYLRTSRGYVQEDQTKARERYEQTAEDLVDVAFDPARPSIFRGDSGRLKTALQLAAIASFEGGFNDWVDDGTCNTIAFQKRAREQHRAECDGGLAFSIWQIHPEAGYIVKDGDLTLARYVPRAYVITHPDDMVSGAKLASDRHYAAEIAYYLIRYSERSHGSLCAYTGENCEGPRPLARQREDRAKNYLASHPFKAPTEEEAAAFARRASEVALAQGSGSSFDIRPSSQ